MPTVFAMGDPISLVHDHPIGNFCVLANDTNTNEDPLVATLITPPSHAASYSLSSDGILSYVPTSFFVGIDTLTYEASSNGETSQATVTIEFTNQAPSLMGQSLSISHGRVLQNIDLLANAYDADGDWLIVSAITAPPAHGTLAQNPANLLWDLTPDSGWTGSDSFQATVSDGVATSWAATFWIDVVNSAPSSASDSYTISHDLTMDTRWSLRDSVLGNDTDADSDMLTAELVDAPAAHATVEFSPDGHFVLTPETGYTGQVSFSYRAFDGLAYSSPTVVTIGVTNDAPSAINLANAAIKIYDTQVGTLSVEDADYLDTPSFALVNSTSYPDNAYFAIEDDQLVVAPEATLSPGSYVVQVQATDGAGATATQTFTITVDNVTVWIDSVQDAIEGESTGYFRLKRSSTEGELTVPYTIDTETTTAESGIDYAPLPLYVTFADGQQYADIVIDPTGDYANAPNDLSKSVFIQLTDMPGGVGVKPGFEAQVQVIKAVLAPPEFTQPNSLLSRC